MSSDIELPGLFPAQGGEAEDDVVIRAGSVPRDLGDPIDQGPVWSMARGLFLLRVPRLVNFLLRDGHSITYQAEPGATEADVTAFLVGTAFGILLHQRDLIVLHASGVSVDGKAVLFLGPSGAGKSTLAAALGERGYPLVTDDFCVVSLDADGAPWVHPDGRAHKLWTQAINQFNVSGRRREAVRGKLEKFYVEPAESIPTETALPLGPVYMLQEARGPLRPGIERPNVVDSATTLRRNAYRPRFARKMGQHTLYFQLAAAVGNRGGVFTLARAMDFAAMDDVVARLERHWGRPGDMLGAA